jgi:hypothetical protein
MLLCTCMCVCTLAVVRNVAARAPRLMSSFFSPVSAGIREACTLVVVGNVAARAPRLMSFFLLQPGSDLAAELGVTAQDDVLFAVFSTPDSAEGMRDAQQHYSSVNK